MSRFAEAPVFTSPPKTPLERLELKINAMIEQSVCHPQKVIPLAFPDLFAEVDAERYRAQLQLCAYWIYKNKHEQIIYNRMKYRYERIWDEYKPFINPALNPLKRIADIKSNLYQKSPVRRVDDGSVAKDSPGNKFIREQVISVNPTLNYANQLHHVQGNPVLWPIYIKQQDKILLRLCPSHEIGLTLGADYQYDIVAYLPELDGMYAVSFFDEGLNQRVQKFCGYEGGKLTFKETAILGLPIFVSSRPYTQEIWEIFDMLDLLRGTLRIGEKESFDERVDFFKSFRQLVATAPNTGSSKLSDEISVSPTSIIETDAGLDYLELASNDLQYQEGIDKQCASYAAMRGVSSLLFWGNFQSKEQQLAISSEIVKHWEHQKDIWYDIEKNLWKSVFQLAVNNDMLPKKAAKWNVETAFASPNPLEDDPTVSLTLFTEKEKLGMTNILDRIIQDNQNINSRDEAMKFYLDNIEIYGESMKMRRALQVPEKEIGTDPDEAEITKKAEQIVEGKLTGNAGARGPTLVPDDSEEPGEET
jgi:hypothetical protein